MPSTSNELRNKFIINRLDGTLDDGIGKAEDIIKSFGGSIEGVGYIVTPWDGQEDRMILPEEEPFWDAAQFLIEEWDYAFLK